MSKKAVSEKTKLMQGTKDWELCQKTKELTIDDTGVQLDEGSPNYKDISTAEHQVNPTDCPATDALATYSTDNQQVSDLPDSDLTIDGPECEFQSPHSYPEPVSLSNASSCNTSMSTSTSSISTPDASVSASLNGSMRDFVVLHTENDYEEAQQFQGYLYTDIADDLSITVDLFSNIDVGTPTMRSLETLHDRYRYILLFVTDSLTNDRYCRFLNEILITLGLRDGGSKAERVVPVFTKCGNCDILELSIILGIPYYRRNSGSGSYLRLINNLVRSARDKFPV